MNAHCKNKCQKIVFESDFESDYFGCCNNLCYTEHCLQNYILLRQVLLYIFSSRFYLSLMLNVQFVYLAI